MDQTYCEKQEYMTDYFSQINFYMYEGPAPRIRARNIPQDFFTCKYEDGNGKINVKLKVNNHSPLILRMKGLPAPLF